MAEPTVNDMMEAYSLDAVDYARANFGVDLDYSDSSIERVEIIAKQLFETIPQSTLGRLFRRGPKDDEIDQVRKMLGGYIGEVYRREFGGEWSFNQDILPGTLVIQLEIGGTRLFPPAKVGKRLSNGAEDNLWSYYKVLKRQLLDKAT